MLKQNEELIKAVKSLQESHDSNFNPKAGSSRQEGVNSTKNNYKEKQHINSYPRMPWEVEPELEPTRLSRKEIQAMIGQQMQTAGDGYTIPPVKNYGHPYLTVMTWKNIQRGT
jgi:hypothetical protein